MITLKRGDCLEILGEVADNTIDTTITDPPYGMGFMNKAWDEGIPSAKYWKAVLRVMKPGGTLLAFGGTRTVHKLTTQIEEAGYEIRDMITWLYGSGFPKSHNISKAIKTADAITWDGWGTGLKPAIEYIVVATKPRQGTYANNALTWGVSGYNINGGRIQRDNIRGYPTNLILSHSMNCADERGRCICPVCGLIGWDAQSIKTTCNRCHRANMEAFRVCVDDCPVKGLGDKARYFYCVKASRKEKDAGLEMLVEDVVDDGRDIANDTAYQRGKTLRHNPHPTVKPIKLMKYLAELTKTPTGGIILDPFMGSGTTGIAAVLTGRDFYGIELSEESYDVARQRIKHWGNTQKG